MPQGCVQCLRVLSGGGLCKAVGTLLNATGAMHTVPRGLLYVTEVPGTLDRDTWPPIWQEILKRHTSLKVSLLFARHLVARACAVLGGFS